MTVLSIVLQVLLGLGFLMFGLIKFGLKQMVDGFKHYGYPGWFRVFTGLVEVISAALVIAGIWNETLAAWGGLFIVATMIGAIFTHIKIKDTVKSMMMPIILLILGLIVLLINFGSLL
ncbi:DoxX family protein [Cytobacillus purgationiresistens]|uniref:Membrane protein YphA (DoxX/SURF4 family) n=1 Tax=Cytobacillus purgationiresistens TaxID=863449 RepID=A0ABU0ANN2_9BACI|nr:DoxX family protein [Cytobacillus purgationiresistens]MDQ0272377.1 putative membrane protein YphA (DoxX/SURF4 family) [Cytobacillus purgationiresistens]